MEMKLMYVFGIVALVLLSLGCVGGNQQSQGTQGGTGQQGGQGATGGTGDTGNSGAGGQTGNGSTGNGGGQTGGNGGTGGNGLGGTVTGGTGGTQDLTSMAWTQLVGLGQPVKCTFDFTSQGQTINAIVYVKGNSFREEMTTNGSTITAIMKQNATNNLVYMDSSMMTSQGMQTDCKWILFASVINGSTTAGVPGEYTPTSPESIENKVDYKCEPGTFGNEEFDTSGKVCTIEEIMQSYGAPQ